MYARAGVDEAGGDHEADAAGTAGDERHLPGDGEQIRHAGTSSVGDAEGLVVAGSQDLDDRVVAVVVLEFAARGDITACITYIDVM